MPSLPPRAVMWPKYKPLKERQAERREMREHEAAEPGANAELWSELPARAAVAGTSEEPRRQLNVDLPASVLHRLRVYAGTHYGATIKGTVEAALVAYLDKKG